MLFHIGSCEWCCYARRSRGSGNGLFSAFMSFYGLPRAMEHAFLPYTVTKYVVQTPHWQNIDMEGTLYSIFLYPNIFWTLLYLCRLQKKAIVTSFIFSIFHLQVYPVGHNIRILNLQRVYLFVHLLLCILWDESQFPTQYNILSNCEMVLYTCRVYSGPLRLILTHPNNHYFTVNIHYSTKSIH